MRRAASVDITGIAFVVNLVFNLVLVPHYSMIGAAISTVIAFVFMPIAMYLKSRQWFHVDYRWRQILSIITLHILLVGSSMIRYDTLLWIKGSFFVAVFFLTTVILKPLQCLRRLNRGEESIA